MTVHDFAESVSRAHTDEGADFWERLYSKFFAGYTSHRVVRFDDDPDLQRAGVDHVVHLSNGRDANVDVKIRDGAWPDIALERWSDRERRIPGWVQNRSLLCHYVAYAFKASRSCWLLPFGVLREAWRRCGLEWIAKAESRESGFRVVEANNGRYITESIAVPLQVIESEIGVCKKAGW